MNAKFSTCAAAMQQSASWMRVNAWGRTLASQNVVMWIRGEHIREAGSAYTLAISWRRGCTLITSILTSTVSFCGSASWPRMAEIILEKWRLLSSFQTCLHLHSSDGIDLISESDGNPACVLTEWRASSASLWVAQRTRERPERQKMEITLYLANSASN